MAYDIELADRVRQTLVRRRGVREIKMFGGLCFTINGNMSVGIAGESLVLRLGERGASAALQEAHTRPMDFTGKPMKSMIYVDPAGFETEQKLRDWVNRSVRFARSLPPTKAGK